MTLRPSLNSVFFLLLGLWIFGMGHALLIVRVWVSVPGQLWLKGFLHRPGGLSEPLYLSLAFWVLVIWIPLRERPGMGTIANIIVVAVAIDMTVPLLPSPTGFVWR
ncbi:MAG: hypothetical protein CM1200mP18_04050 [Gammaproteobacteria bacterium]|nr:MAG: hypothetical protein CM1200mP18_04050 [Gammaproteobacteria bacterium]